MSCSKYLAAHISHRQLSACPDVVIILSKILDIQPNDELHGLYLSIIAKYKYYTIAKTVTKAAS